MPLSRKKKVSNYRKNKFNKSKLFKRKTNKRKKIRSRFNKKYKLFGGEETNFYTQNGITCPLLLLPEVNVELLDIDPSYLSLLEEGSEVDVNVVTIERKDESPVTLNLGEKNGDIVIEKFVYKETQTVSEPLYRGDIIINIVGIDQENNPKGEPTGTDLDKMNQILADLTIKKYKIDKKSNMEEIRIKKESDGPLGLGLGQDEKEIFTTIKKIIENTPAANSKKLTRGDIIHSVTLGENTETEFDKITKLIRDAKKGDELVIKKPKNIE